MLESDHASEDDRLEDDVHKLTEREQEELAAAEAGAIGGSVPDYSVDEMSRPLAESGEGEAEGFELAEHDLEVAATSGNTLFDPQFNNAFQSEAESDEATAVYGEADAVDPSDESTDHDA